MPEEPLEAMCRRVVLVMEDLLRTLDVAASSGAITDGHVPDLLVLRDRARLLTSRATTAAIKAGELKRG